MAALWESRLWVHGLDLFKGQISLRTLGGRSRPDLIGQDAATGAWHAFESKGRSAAPSHDDKIKAKAQANRVVSVDGVTCSLHIGSIAYFRRDILHFYWCDPEPDGEAGLEPIALELPEDAWRAYFEPLADLMDLGEREGSALPGVVMRRLEGLDLEVGLAKEIYPVIEARDWAGIRNSLSNLSGVLEERGLRSDGVYVKTGPNWARRYREWAAE